MTGDVSVSTHLTGSVFTGRISRAGYVLVEDEEGILKLIQMCRVLRGRGNRGTQDPVVRKRKASLPAILEPKVPTVMTTKASSRGTITTCNGGSISRVDVRCAPAPGWVSVAPELQDGLRRGRGSEPCDTHIVVRLAVASEWSRAPT
jgi:hypothetical protein